MIVRMTVVWTPQTVRVKMSRPSRSVPKMWSRLGPSWVLKRSVSEYEWVEIGLAKIPTA